MAFSYPSRPNDNNKDPFNKLRRYSVPPTEQAPSLATKSLSPNSLGFGGAFGDLYRRHADTSGFTNTYGNTDNKGSFWDKDTFGLGIDAVSTVGDIWKAIKGYELGNKQIGIAQDQLAQNATAQRQNLQLGVDTQNLNIAQINAQRAMQRDVIAKTRLHQDAGAYAGYQDLAHLSVPA